METPEERKRRLTRDRVQRWRAKQSPERLRTVGRERARQLRAQKSSNKSPQNLSRRQNYEAEYKRIIRLRQKSPQQSIGQQQDNVQNKAETELQRKSKHRIFNQQKLSKWPNARQRNRMTELVELNNVKLTGFGTAMSHEIWNNMASELNNLGSKKTIKQWRKYWSKMKFETKKELKNLETENNPTLEETFRTEIECSSNITLNQVSKPNSAQKLRLVELAEFNYNELYQPGIVRDRCLEIWEEMVQELNKLGPKKDLKQWRKFWSNIKSNIKSKMKNPKIILEPIELHFSNEEERVMRLFDMKWDDDQTTDDKLSTDSNTSVIDIKTEIAETSDISEDPQKFTTETCDTFNKNLANHTKHLADSYAFDVMKDIQDDALSTASNIPAIVIKTEISEASDINENHEKLATEISDNLSKNETDVINFLSDSNSFHTMKDIQDDELSMVTDVKMEILETSDNIENYMEPEVFDHFSEHLAEQMKLLSQSNAFAAMKEINDILLKYQTLDKYK